MFRIALAALAIMPVPLFAGTLTTVEVAPNTYAIEGPFGQRDAENLGNNATFGLIVTDDGAVLVDAGGTYKGAAALDEVIGTLTDQPVKYVIDTGGQDHRWLGNGYWKEHGAEIITSEDALADQKARASLELTMLDALVGQEALAGTEPVYADTTFDESYTLTLGGREIEITHPGPAHTPGDSFVWLPAEKVMFTGDIVFVGRILGVLDMSSSSGWVEAFEAMAAYEPAHVVPGHGPATDLATATKDTYDYLTNLRSQMADYIDQGGDIIGSVNVDQSQFEYLEDFDTLAKRNAQAVFSQMEWE
ncbi:MBL fold metallo-hydrolase [Thioclava sp.]|uniref:MBL fold metallo-hydrolase n=1 Tax=Thioclava sp. TaxID=1933450 RepID=UPI003242277F